MEPIATPVQNLPVLDEFAITEKSTQKPLEPVLKSTGATKEGAPVSLLLGVRQKKIVEFLENTQQAQVMDLQKVLPSVTKRTIRRDLEELIGLGKITRLGEFNQVFYSLKR